MSATGEHRCNAPGRAPSLAPFRAILRAGLALTVLLFGAAVVHHGAFDLQARPAGLLYFASYLVVGCGSVWILRTLHTGQR